MPHQPYLQLSLVMVDLALDQLAHAVLICVRQFLDVASHVAAEGAPAFPGRFPARALADIRIEQSKQMHLAPQGTQLVCDFHHDQTRGRMTGQLVRTLRRQGADVLYVGGGESLNEMVRRVEVRSKGRIKIWIGR